MSRLDRTRRFEFVSAFGRVLALATAIAPLTAIAQTAKLPAGAPNQFFRAHFQGVVGCSQVYVVPNDRVLVVQSVIAVAAYLGFYAYQEFVELDSGAGCSHPELRLTVNRDRTTVVPKLGSGLAFPPGTIVSAQVAPNRLDLSISGYLVPATGIVVTAAP